MKKLLCMLLILCMCVSVLSACLGDESVSDPSDSNKNNGTTDGSSSSDGSSTDDSSSSDGSTDGSTEEEDSIDGTSKPEPAKGEAVSEDVFNAVTAKDHKNYTVEIISSADGVTLKSVCKVDHPNAINVHFENGRLSTKLGMFTVDGIMYETSYNSNTDKWVILRTVDPSVIQYPIDDMPCSFAELIFDEKTGEYSAKIEMDGSEGEIKLRFNGGNLTYAFAQVDYGVEQITEEYFFYDYGTTKVNVPDKADIVQGGGNENAGDAESDESIDAPSAPGNDFVDKEEIERPDVDDNTSDLPGSNDENKDESGETTVNPQNKPNVNNPYHKYDMDGDGVPDSDFNGDGVIDKNDFPDGYYGDSSQGSTSDDTDVEDLKHQLKAEANDYIHSIPSVRRGSEISLDDWNLMKSNPPTNYTYATERISNGKRYIEITMINGEEFMNIDIVDGTITYKWCGRMENGRIVGYECDLSSGMWKKNNSSLSSNYPMATIPFELDAFNLNEAKMAYCMVLGEGSAAVELYFKDGLLSRIDQISGNESIISFFYDYGTTEIKFPEDDRIDASSDIVIIKPDHNNSDSAGSADTSGTTNGSEKEPDSFNSSATVTDGEKYETTDNQGNDKIVVNGSGFATLNKPTDAAKATESYYFTTNK